MKKMNKKMGRPTKYTKDLADKICKLLAEGKSMRTVCKEEDMPGMETIFSWLRTKKEFQEQYTQAKQESADALVEEMIDIADDGTNDFMTITKGDKKYNVEDREVVNRSRLRVDTRKWIASKLKPKKYSEKLDVGVSGSLTVVFDESLKKTHGSTNDQTVHTS